MIEGLIPYYLHWYHERPVGITSARRAELNRLHRILYACAEHFALHYKDYVDQFMPLGEKEMQILQMQEAYPFRAGTWRPDYIITEEGSLKICEITSRFFAHGIFMSWYAEKAADKFMARFPGKTRNSRYGEMMDYMLEILEGKRCIYVLKSADRTGEIRLYKEFYERHGCTVTVLEAPEVEPRRADWARPGVFLISALNQMDLLSFSMDTLRAMMDAGMYSDFRNIFLIHDKRFMRLWYEDAFTSAFLNPDDTAFLRAHAIGTSLCENVPDAKSNKNAYIIKPYCLGKSEGVHAGVLTSQEEWEKLLEHPEGMIIQPFLKQRTYETVWEGIEYQDYMCGMMLCVNERYFGDGLFRASSLPVTNVGDDRKACFIDTDDPELLAHCDVL
ncbi:MAG: hypothetical protein J5769_03215 [Bacteroidales bacterium]|nr:hypothetical protein [Bacteroidales bacterium]